MIYENWKRGFKIIVSLPPTQRNVFLVVQSKRNKDGVGLEIAFLFLKPLQKM